MICIGSTVLREYFLAGNFMCSARAKPISVLTIGLKVLLCGELSLMS
ncbi:hypothetical protein Mal48_13450 [Thalassoglobus polymorphus]|uniref:Uncharacterized protein n=1 Tax=Thalassoglobus polymorphus TaxID=2527994 RepID=A0A517QKH8_9PLAN|nr:hypothetical protein Mal48_13450 [Thalassoglobus polymorphus]